MALSKMHGRLYRQLVISFVRNCSAGNVHRQRYSSQSTAVAIDPEALNLQQTVKSWQDLPGPRSLPFIGTIYKYLPGGEYHAENRTNAEWKKFKKYGDIVKEEIFPGEVFIHLYHPDDIEHVYRNEGKYPFRGELRATAKYRGDLGLPKDIGSSKGAEWSKVRFPVAKEMLTPKQVASYLSVQESVARDLVSVLKANRQPDTNSLDIMPELNKYTMEAISPVVFGKRLEMMKAKLEPEAASMFDAVHNTFEAIYYCTFFWPMHKNGKSKVWKKFAKGMDFMYQMSTKYTSQSLHSSKTEETVCQRLRARGLSDQEAAEMAQGLFFGAIDTTANSIFFLLYNLAKHPEKQEKLYQNICDTFPNRDIPITEDGLRQMAYLRACVKESFRLTPTATGTLRILDKEIILRNHRIPAGMQIQLHNAVISRRDDIFDSPGNYLPERWLRGASPKLHPYATLPFSHGTRNCVGKRFAEQEIMLATIQILQHFKVEHIGAPVEIKTKMLSYPANNSNLRFTDRK